MTIRDQSLIDNITATEIEDGTEPVRWSFPKASPVAEMFPFLAWRDEDADSISIEADEGELMVLHVAALSHACWYTHHGADRKTSAAGRS